jgi:hypothetical protein
LPLALLLLPMGAEFDPGAAAGGLVIVPDGAALPDGAVFWAKAGPAAMAAIRAVAKVTRFIIVRSSRNIAGSREERVANTMVPLTATKKLYLRYSVAIASYALLGV